MTVTGLHLRSDKQMVKEVTSLENLEMFFHIILAFWAILHHLDINFQLSFSDQVTSLEKWLADGQGSDFTWSDRHSFERSDITSFKCRADGQSPSVFDVRDEYNVWVCLMSKSVNLAMEQLVFKNEFRVCAKFN